MFTQADLSKFIIQVDNVHRSFISQHELFRYDEENFLQQTSRILRQKYASDTDNSLLENCREN